MSAPSVAGAVEDVIRRELDDVERAIKRGDSKKALSELDDAVRKLRDIVSAIRRLG